MKTKLQLFVVMLVLATLSIGCAHFSKDVQTANGRSHSSGLTFAGGVDPNLQNEEPAMIQAETLMAPDGVGSNYDPDYAGYPDEVVVVERPVVVRRLAVPRIQPDYPRYYGGSSFSFNYSVYKERRPRYWGGHQGWTGNYSRQWCAPQPRYCPAPQPQPQPRPCPTPRPQPAPQRAQPRPAPYMNEAPCPPRR